MRRLPLLWIALLAALSGCGGGEGPAERAAPPRADSAPSTAPPSRPAPAPAKPLRSRGEEPRLETVATGLEAPWEIAFLPDRRALITERPGRVRLLERNGEVREEPVAEVEVAAIGEGGLLGLAVDPEFRRNRFVYLYRTTDSGNEVRATASRARRSARTR